MKKTGILLLTAVLVMGTVGCGTSKKAGDKETIKKEVVQIEETVEQEDSTLTNDTIEETTVNSEDSNENQDLDNKNESTSNKNETTTKPSTGNTDSNKKPSTGSTTKPNTGSTGNSGSTNNSGSTGNTQNNNSGTTTQPSTPVHEHKWTEVKETVVVKGAWVEDVFAWRTICGRCGLDMTEMTDDELAIHTIVECNSRYSAEYIKIDEIQHPAVTEERVTGYKCSCGATK